MIEFVLIESEADLTLEDRKTLMRSVKRDVWNTKSLDEVLAEKGTMTYRISGDATGLIMAQKAARNGRFSLYVKHLAGKGMLRESDRIMETIRFLAKELECDTVTCTVMRRGLVEHYREKLAFQIESVNMVAEV